MPDETWDAAVALHAAGVNAHAAGLKLGLNYRTTWRLWNLLAGGREATSRLGAQGETPGAPG